MLYYSNDSEFCNLQYYIYIVMFRCLIFRETVISIIYYYNFNLPSTENGNLSIC